MKWHGIIIDKQEKKSYPTAPYTKLKWELDKSGQYVVISGNDADEPPTVMHHSNFHRLVVMKQFVYK